MLNFQVPTIPNMLTPQMQEAIDFLNLVLPSGQNYYATSSYRPGDFSTWRDAVQPSFYNMVATAFSLSDAGYNTYFALSSFAQDWHKITTPTGKQKNVYRTAENATYQKAFWLDIDVDPSLKKSPYGTVKEAIYALDAFLKSSSLPDPTVILSGSGMHVYWPFVEAIPTTTWQRAAHILRCCTVHQGLAVDHSRTTDAASVLRIPNTINYGKDGQTRPVKVGMIHGPYNPVELLQTLLAYVDAHKVSLTLDATKKKASGLVANNVPSLLNAPEFGDSYVDTPKHPFGILKNCKQIQLSGTGNYDQWYNMMLVMKHCYKGEWMVHEISKLDTERYTFEGTQAKFQQAIDGGCGPALCSTFHTKTPGICDTCPHRGKISTPLQLGEPHVEPQKLEVPAPVIDLETKVALVLPDAPKMPIENYVSEDKRFAVVPGKGVVWYKREMVTDSENPDEQVFKTTEFLICDAEIYIHSLCVDRTGPELQRSYVLRKQVPGRVGEDILFDIKSHFGQNQMIQWLAQHGMLPKQQKFHKPMGEFMNSYLAAVQSKLPEIEVRDHFGWVTVTDRVTGARQECFIVGEDMYTPTGVQSVKLNDNCKEIASTRYVPSGSLEEWKKLPAMYKTLNQKAPQLFVCAAFAAPFMRFANGTATNALFSMWDTKGGKGKSSLIAILDSIWGNPYTCTMGSSDTMPGRFNMLSARRNLPVCMDEMTTMSDEQIAGLLYDIANGRDKVKAQSGSQLARTGKWQTVSFFTSNKSMYEMMARYRQQSTATSMRVLEVQCDFPDYAQTDPDTHAYIEDTLSLLKMHYGLAGRHFIAECLKVPDLFKKIPVAAMAWDKEHRHHTEERFWTAAIGMAIVAGTLAKAAGLIDYDMEELSAWCKNTLLPMLRNNIRNERAVGSNSLTDFLNDNIGSTVVVQTADRPANSNDHSASPTTLGLDSYVVRLPHDKVQVRMELDTQTAYISARTFKNWHTKHGLSAETTLQELTILGVYDPVADKDRVCLGKHVKAIELGRTITYRFDLRKLGHVPSALLVSP